MIELRRGTTENITITLPEDIRIPKASEIYIDLIQDDTVITKTKDDITIYDNTITATLTPDETLKLQAGYVASVQITLDFDGTIIASDKEPVRVKPVIVERGND